MQTLSSLIRLKFIFSRVWLILFGSLIGLGAIEIGLSIFPIPNRFVLTQQLENLWESDDELLLHLKPNLNLAITGHPEFRFVVKTNEDGLRDEPFTSDQTIAAIGDSFTFGFGVEVHEAWPAQIEALSGQPVANLGWAGWSSYTYPAAIRRHAIPTHASLWLWAFFANDLPESTSAEAFITSGQTDFKTWSQKNNTSSNLSRFPFNLRTVQLLTALFHPDLFLLPNSGNEIFDDGTLRFRYSLYPWQMTDPSNPQVRRGWELTEEALLNAHQLAVENQAQLVVIFIPSREYVYWPYLQNVMAGVDIQQLDDVQVRLAQICQENDIAYFNLLPGMREIALTGQMLYFPNDGHWNADGHALAAYLVYASLQAHQLVSERTGK